LEKLLHLKPDSLLKKGGVLNSPRNLQFWQIAQSLLLSQFFPDRKVLWMTTKPLLKISIKFNMFDCIGAVFTYVHGTSSTLGPVWVRKLDF